MLYNFRGLRYLLCCLLILPLVSFLLALPGKFLCRVKMEAAQTEGTRGDEAVFTVKVKNRSPFPIARLRLDLRWEAPGGESVRERRWLQGLGMNCEEKFTLRMSAEHCGMAALSIKKAMVCDYLGVFAFSVARRKREEVCILPVITPVSASIREICSANNAKAGTEREGDLLLRDFLPGDSMHRIYWKLAAKDRELQVRDFERSGDVTLFLKFTEELTQQADRWDRYLDRASSLLYFLAEEAQQNLQFSLGVVWRRGELYLKSDIPSGEAVQVWMHSLLKGEAAGIFLTEEELQSLENGFCLEEDGELYLNGSPVAV